MKKQVPPKKNKIKFEAVWERGQNNYAKLRIESEHLDIKYMAPELLENLRIVPSRQIKAVAMALVEAINKK